MNSSCELDESDYEGEEEEEAAEEDQGEDSVDIDVAVSLFDDYSSPSVHTVWAHMREIHGFDMQRFRAMFAPFTDYHRLSLVNYLRHAQKDGRDVKQVASAITKDSPFWMDDKYLQPVMADDRLLWDTDGDEEWEDAGAYEGASAAQLGGPSESEERIAALTEQLMRARAVIARLTSEQDEGEDGNTQRGRGPFRAPEDSAYFDSYSYDAIHREMIMDEVRTGAYQDFIMHNKEMFEGKIVLDVGCGSGILSLFAARAGAKLVVGVDASTSIVHKARRIVKDNGMADRIKIIAAKVEEIELSLAGGTLIARSVDGTLLSTEAPGDPQQTAADVPPGCPEDPFRCDLIVSEWFGYALFYESMVYSVLHAREKWLVSGGLIVPNRVEVKVYAADFDARLGEEVDRWEQPVFGLDLSTLSPATDPSYVATPLVECVSPDQLVSPPYQLKTIDLLTITRTELEHFREPFFIQCNRGDSVTPEQHSPYGRTITSIVLFFDVFFDPSSEVYGHTSQRERPTGAEGSGRCMWFSTGPKSPPTHWKQTILHLRGKDGRRLRISLPCGSSQQQRVGSGNTRTDGEGEGDGSPVPVVSSSPDGKVTLRGHLQVTPHHDNFRHISVAVELRGVVSESHGLSPLLVNTYDMR
ncbi:unnamed protein product [Vitrella brassicaformis CCMP3155]|uniref:Protein arginine N-methyltransferase domain-containing protein n=1 Tax=Vitrella brassicaformis (strain CCMP3155) TaxID=1169540 RepID=A0A0G4GVI3_VITBC|nr:unnamed protein product [Vitrella brassicaformis CCMP3155]|eukprot:CEM34870.1 unnamed protein product [Vitrella brassicaformis CCMP3155]